MRNLLKTFTFAVVFILLANAVALAQAWPPSKAASDAASDKLLDLTSKGLVRIQIDPPAAYMFVEPRGWNGLSHMEKANLVLTGMQSVKFQNNGHDLAMLMVFDMTSKDTVAVGTLSNGKVDIRK